MSMGLFRTGNHNAVLLSGIALSTILVMWAIVSSLELVNPLFIPRIEETFFKLIEQLLNVGTYKSIGVTIYRALLGLTLSVLFGVPFGLLLARIKWLYSLFEIPIEFLRAIPSSALFPLFILFFGIGDLSKIAVVFYGCSLIMLINAYYGALPNPEKNDRLNMMKAMNASNYQIFRYVTLYDALPHISSGIRVCLSLSFVLVVVTEMFLGANEGIGKMIYDFYLQYRISDMYASIFLLGTVGFSANKLYLVFENKYIFWQRIT